MTTKKRPYKLLMKETGEQYLVNAANEAQARNHIAKAAIECAVAKPKDVYTLAKSGVIMQETGTDSDQETESNDDMWP